MISNNLWVLLATPATAPRVQGCTHYPQTHTQNSHLFSSTNTHTGVFVCLCTVGFANTVVKKKTHTNTNTTHHWHSLMERRHEITTSSISTNNRWRNWYTWIKCSVNTATVSVKYCLIVKVFLAFLDHLVFCLFCLNCFYLFPLLLLNNFPLFLTLSI